MGFLKALFGNSTDDERPSMARPIRFNSKSEMDQALINAVINGDCEYLQNLIDAGADVNAKKPNQNGLQFTALQWAAQTGSPRVCEAAHLLIDAGADVNRKTTAGMTALHFALNRKHADIAKLLINSGADVTLRSNRESWGRGHTPLDFAISSCRTDLVKLVLDAGADVHESDGEGKTALKGAAIHAADVTRLILDAGADVNTKAKNGETALIAAHYSTSQI